MRWTLIAGAPTATERDGERLLRVLRRIADETPLPLRIGANLGVVFVGDMGHPQRCTYIVMGDATNLAARLMAKATPGQIIAGERLHNTCPGRFEFDAARTVPRQGQASRRSRRSSSDRSSSHRGVDDVNSVGRSTSQWSGATRSWRSCCRSSAAGGVVELVGEAGVGKTRLWQEARRIEVDRRWLVMRRRTTRGRVAVPSVPALDPSRVQASMRAPSRRQLSAADRLRSWSRPRQTSCRGCR